MTLPRRAVEAILNAYTVGALIISSNAFLTLLIGGNDPTKTSLGSPYFQAAWALVYLVTLVRALRQHRAFVSLARANKPLVCLVLLTFASVLWSIEPGVTFHGAAILLFTTLFAMDMCLHYSISRQIKLIFTALALAITCSVIAEIFFHGVVPGLPIEVPAWHGVFGTKNEFARVVTIGVATFLASRRQLWAKALVVIAGAALAALARSMGGLAYLSAIVGLSIWLSVLRWRPKPRRLALVATAIIVLSSLLFVASNFARITEFLGRDPHLTGRTTLWSLALDDIKERPILGYGYYAFWNKDSHPAWLIREESRWEDAPHSHNGYIDFSLGLGLVGLFTYAVLYCTICKRAYVFFMSGEESDRRWPLLYLGVVALYQLTESSIVTGDSLVWILYCCVIFSLSPVKRLENAQHRTVVQQLAA